MTKARSLADFISDGNPLADGTIAVSEVSGAAPLASPSFTGNIAVTGNVDGRDVAADGTKLDGIETSATADQTDAEIRTAVEAATDSNVFTDADHTKLNAIEASADVTDTVNVVAALTAGSNITIASDGTIAGAAQYTHPTHAGDDAAIDTGALSGAAVISDLDLNITTDTLGHVTDANATVATRNLTLGDLGYTGATNANYITNNNQLTNGAGYTTGAFPSGTKMMFQQTSAPTGWTKDTSHNNKALRVVNGTAGSGGSVNFTTAFANKTTSGSIGNTSAGGTVAGHTLTTAETPSHSHTFNVWQSTSNTAHNGAGAGNTNFRSTQSVSSVGGNGSHNHGFTGASHNHSFSGSAIDLRVQYVDLIIATKD